MEIRTAGGFGAQMRGNPAFFVRRWAEPPLTRICLKVSPFPSQKLKNIVN